MKRILSFLIIALMLIGTFTAYAEETMVYSFAAESGKVGDTIKVTISVKHAPEIASYMTTLCYDPAVLKPTGKYQKMNMGGMMVVNTNAPVEKEGFGAIRIACATTSKKSIISGDMDLLNLSFEIVGPCADEKGSLIEIVSHSFSLNDENLSKIPSLIVQPCRVQVAAEAPAPETPDAPTPDAPETEPEQKPEESAPEEELPEEEKPTGDWYIDPDSNQAVHIDKNEAGQDVNEEFIVEFEKDEDGKTTGVILFDEENNEIGKLDVEEDEYGNLTVLKQVFYTEGRPWYFWVALGFGGLLVLAGIAALIYTTVSKKKR